ncbi:MAG: hypothetical protein HKL82_09960 [Acidimicrobiaceae bacterium]|nr:hypothetical protein [Acidimicrobiaceae bacterium]
MRQVGIVFGGPSPEHDISILTGLQAARALRSTGVQVHGLFWNKSGEWFLVDPLKEAQAFANERPDGGQSLYLRLGSEPGFYPPAGRLGRAKPIELEAVVNACHGGPGEDGSLQAVLDQAGIAYTGPSARTASLGMDKLAFYGVVAQAGLPALQRVLLDRSTSEVPFDPPFIVKPRFGGSSIGIEVVSDLPTAQMRLGANVHLRAGAVLEPYRPDLFDIQIAARNYPGFELSAIERPLRKGVSKEILSYSDKYIAGEGMSTAPRELPAAVSNEFAERLRSYAKTVAGLVGIRGIMRFDFMAGADEQLYVNEVNTIPGSLSHYLWIDPKVAFEKLLSQMIEEALEVPSFSPVVAGADGSVLRSASSIAAKLA